MHTPIALFIFRRPDTTARVFDAIRAARPPRLLVVADGPRSERADDEERCAQTRRLIQVDWPCQVEWQAADTNLGCRARMASGISWVFEQVEEAILLEDDCVPDPSFFPFAEELLERYREDRRVMHISGSAAGHQVSRTPFSYVFSQLPRVWGWASWRRAWAHYDDNVTVWPTLREGGWLRDALGSRLLARHWAPAIDMVARRAIDTWDFQWNLACWAQHGLCVQPLRNLVTNIGFGTEATHTTTESMWARTPPQPMEFPLRHPTFLVPDVDGDERSIRAEFGFAARLFGAAARLRRLGRGG